MNINLTKDILKAQALLLQSVSTRADIQTGDSIKITLSSCYQLMAQSYGFKDWNTLSALLKEGDK